MKEVRYAGYPSTFVYAVPNADPKKWIDHLLWGDWMELQGEEQGDWVKIRVRGRDANNQPKMGWVNKLNKDGKPNFQKKQLLEIYFVDIGQGDGCFMVTPDNRFLVIDAGEGDNMRRFLRWKFNLKHFNANPIPIQHAIITHSDKDHYNGFAGLFADPQFDFANIHHNGIVEREGAELFGAIDKTGTPFYVTDIIVDNAGLQPIIDDQTKVGAKLYPNLLKTIAARGSQIRMLCSEDKFLAGYDETAPVTIRVLAPVPELDAAGKRRLRWFTDTGKTKNGHSVVLKLEYGAVKILLGGDLNIPAENYLLECYTGIDPTKIKDEIERLKFIEKARETFAVDICKACHHGSGDFTSLFLAAINSAATIISSGDDESHAHPRPDSLGAFGKFGRGERPLIFSTELARSAKELIKSPSAVEAEIDELTELRNEVISPEMKAKIEEKIAKKRKKLFEKIERTVTVYGLINLRTDGEKVLFAQRLEAKAERGEWDIHLLEQNKKGVLTYVSKH